MKDFGPCPTCGQRRDWNIPPVILPEGVLVSEVAHYSAGVDLGEIELSPSTLVVHASIPAVPERQVFRKS